VSLNPRGVKSQVNNTPCNICLNCPSLATKEDYIQEDMCLSDSFIASCKNK